MKDTPDAIWERFWRLVFKVDDRDWRGQTPSLKEMARLLGALVHAIEDDLATSMATSESMPSSLAGPERPGADRGRVAEGFPFEEAED